ncbi:MAG TPA: M14 family zinc carboxypeptidase [Rubricoccaceae bacterium]|nr:M14 family zinc carboxypeptidase [Rubricoccaceae bacterium]
MPSRALLALVLAALAAPFAPAQPVPERHSEVRLFVPDGAPVARPGLALAERLAAHGLVLDHARVEDTPHGLAFRTVLSETELAAARAADVEVEVLVEDVTAHYLATRRGTCEEGMGVSRIAADLCGPMGGYLTFDGVVAALDTLHARYPEVVSARASIGQGHEGRDLWMVEISDHPGVDEGEPEALYTGVHHAREPGSMMAVLYFMYYLAEQYETNPEVRDLVDERRLFFVPVVNPDGYVFNETTDPDGGGMWRKNLRDNGDGSFGVDVNRNYGYEWGYDDVGSSPLPGSETYRGPAPFSEPEIVALRDFLEGGRRVSMAFNYHTYSDLLLYPWGYTPDLQTPDDDVFAALGDTLTHVNGYTYGQGSITLYLTNGGAYDWMYGEQETKPKAFAFTVEVGYWFWPDPIDVYALADENLEANLLLARFAGAPPVAAEPPASPLPGPTLELTGPNPVRTRTGVAFTLAAPGPARLAVYDVLGREVAVLADGPRSAGRNEVAFDASGLAPGVYVLRLTAGGEAAVRRLTVAR